jgi:hypothetical protein
MQVLLKKQCKAKKEAGEGWKITASSLSSLKKKHLKQEKLVLDLFIYRKIIFFRK